MARRSLGKGGVEEQGLTGQEGSEDWAEGGVQSRQKLCVSLHI